MGGWRDQNTMVMIGKTMLSHKIYKALPMRQEKVGLAVKNAQIFHYFGIT